MSGFFDISWQYPRADAPSSPPSLEISISEHILQICDNLKREWMPGAGGSRCNPS
jgi:hypothetical protein